ncbi:beta-1,3-galactosyltransferase 5-like isoform X1 [Gigantopelta aegis]|uniref:beta-1,3-galactosyltransferase 5-like isoform X1 n=1 Tax=Gigantopelta aegis TaxID=1735272 RepID=UPI001B88ADF1|nr:beta-1,3-galactosyltransferase 5-like isoform X1 [Gigantopelta aegis]
MKWRISLRVCFGRKLSYRIHKLILVSVAIVLLCVIIFRKNNVNPISPLLQSKNEMHGPSLMNTTFTITHGSITKGLPKATFQLHKGHRFNFTINNSCKWTINLLVVVCSSFANILERHAIRASWGSQDTLDSDSVLIMFLIGQQEKRRPFMQSLINKENEIYQDIIQANFVDTYYNLTMKSISLLQWASMYCKSAKYVLKVDDDVYTNIKILLSLVATHNSTEKFMMGLLRKNVDVLRNQTRGTAQKWVLSYEEYPNKTFPLYLLGAAYLISGPAVAGLYNATFKVPLLKLEDVYITGLCAQAAGVSRINSSKLLFVTRRARKLAHHAVNAFDLRPATILRVHRLLRRITK